MKFIEIDNKLINLDNVVTISQLYDRLYIYFNGDENNYVSIKYDNEEQVESEYNRIKSILIGDNNE